MCNFILTYPLRVYKKKAHESTTKASPSICYASYSAYVSVSPLQFRYSAHKNVQVEITAWLPR
jgi:hypothetical protein